MNIYNFISDYVFMDIDRIIIKDNDLNIVASGSYRQVMNWAIDSDDTVEGVTVCNGNLTIILD